MKGNFQQSPKDLTSFLFLNPVSFYKNHYKKQKVPETSYQSNSSLSYMFRHLVNFYALIQIDFLVIEKITIYNLCKSFYVIIILFSTFFEILKRWIRKGRITKIRISRLRKERVLVDETRNTTSLTHSFPMHPFSTP